MDNRNLLRDLLKLAGLLVALAALAAVLTWRWNHEMVRVYDLPPVPWWAFGAVALVGFVVWAAVKRGEIFR
jgi:hypothetical protein